MVKLTDREKELISQIDNEKFSVYAIEKYAVTGRNEAIDGFYAAIHAIVEEIGIENLLNESEVGRVYRSRDREYMIEDAMRQVEVLYGEDMVKKLPYVAFVELVIRFMDEQDCNVAENVTWREVIEEYMEEIENDK